ncbi:MAG: T9SS type A sorting domain-containing protein [Bacteroidetes bacterium]|nr:T9SS type A sorting domain-containing protein [Bacteroidota bacterium]
MKTNQIKLLVTVFLCLGLMQAWAQKDVMAAGGNATGSGGSASYSVGQVVYTTATGTNGSANQGVQQPYEIFIVGIDNNPGVNLQLTVYPNPASVQVTLNIGRMNSENMDYRLYDFMGKLLDSQKIRTELTEIPMANFPVGTYLLKVLDGQSLLRTFKIIKN